MELFGRNYPFLFAIALLILVTASTAAKTRFRDRRDTRGCCLPDTLSGQISLSPQLRDRLQGHRGSPSFSTPVKFIVDYERGFLYGEHFVRYPQTRHVQFMADIRDEVRKLYIRERTSNRCWSFPLGARQRNRCSLDDAKYRGRLDYDERGTRRGKGRRSGLLFDRSSQSRNEPLLTWLKFRSLLLVDSDTCLPILDVDEDDMDNYIAFHKLKYGIDSSEESWNYESSTGVFESCTDQGLAGGWDSQDGDVESEAERYHGSWRGERKGQERGDRERWFRLLAGLGKYRKDNDDRYEEDDSANEINRILQFDIYLYLLQHFFPRTPPEPCCGPNQWQASITKTITYTYLKSNYVGKSTTSIPHLYVDHTNGRMAANIAEYVNGSATTNISLLGLFGQVSSNSQLSIYVIDWNKSPVVCTYIVVTDVLGPMRNSCMPASAEFERTVRLGSGPFNSVSLDVYNVTGSGHWNVGEMYYGAESYVSPRDCMTVMETYTWKSPGTKVSGSVLVSNPLPHIIDPTSAFAVPSMCSSTTPLKLTSAQIEGAISNALAYAGVN